MEGTNQPIKGHNMKFLLGLVCLLSISSVFAGEVRNEKLLTDAISKVESAGNKCIQNTSKVATKVQACLLGDMYCTSSDIFYCEDANGVIGVKIKAVYSSGYGQPTVLKKVTVTDIDSGVKQILR